MLNHIFYVLFTYSISFWCAAVHLKHFLYSLFFFYIIFQKVKCVNCAVSVLARV